MTVGELATRMSVDEFIAWRAFDIVNPIGGERADRHAALICSVMANIHDTRRGQHDHFTLDDFDLYRERRPLTREEEEAQFRAAFEAVGLVRRG